jgi:hypothetical protein
VTTGDQSCSSVSLTTARDLECKIFITFKNLRKCCIQGIEENLFMNLKLVCLFFPYSFFSGAFFLTGLIGSAYSLSFTARYRGVEQIISIHNFHMQRISIENESFETIFNNA